LNVTILLDSFDSCLRRATFHRFRIGNDRIQIEAQGRKATAMNNAVREVLLVEPEPVVSEVTGFRLELLGYRVIRVESAEAAFVKISESTPDLVITDLVLPGLDGIGFIEQLMTAKETSDLKILVLSIDADLSRVQAAYNAGARDFIVVPLHLEVLEEKVSKLLANAPVRNHLAKAKTIDVEPAKAQAPTTN